MIKWRWLPMLFCLITATARAATGLAVADVVGELRRNCAAGDAAVPALSVSARLSAAAAGWAEGRQLDAALAQAGYRTLALLSFHVSGAGDRATLQHLLRREPCSALADPQLRDLGFHRQGDAYWIVLATPHLPAELDVAALRAQVLKLTNAARAVARRCGARSMAAAAALRAAPLLDAAAGVQVRDMAQHDFFEHQGSDGSTPAQRVARGGYAYRIVGENLAVGPESAREVVDGWLASPGHCENLMDPRFTEMGLAPGWSTRGPLRLYWSQVFAAPQAAARK